MNTYPIINAESILVEKCLAGDKLAHKTLYTKYFRAMYANIIRIVGNKNDAEDLLQEAFVKVFSKLHTYKGDATLGAWIKKIAINVSLNHIRSQKNLFWADLDSHEFKLENVAEEDQKIQYNVKKVHEAIKLLPTGCRVVFNLFTMEGYQHKEIAEILNISESTSKSQYQRARKLLKQRLKPEDCILN